MIIVVSLNGNQDDGDQKNCGANGGKRGGGEGERRRETCEMENEEQGEKATHFCFVSAFQKTLIGPPQRTDNGNVKFPQLRW